MILMAALRHIFTKYTYVNIVSDVTVPSRRRKRVPIVEECCENTCTPHHLKAYCWENQRYLI